VQVLDLYIEMVNPCTAAAGPTRAELAQLDIGTALFNKGHVTVLNISKLVNQAGAPHHLAGSLRAEAGIIICSGALRAPERGAHFVCGFVHGRAQLAQWNKAAAPDRSVRALAPTHSD